MSKRATTCGCLAVLCAAVLATAGERGTAAEAQALLAKAVTFMEKQGATKALAAFNDPQGAFRDRDLYVFCYGPDNKITAHVSPERLGQDVTTVTDADGKLVGQEMMKVVGAGGGTLEYRYLNPATKKIENKHSFVQRAGDQVCGVGAYK
jgi:signal transduction histidine kinase